MTRIDPDTQYTSGIVRSMQEIFGRGFLSPGGSAEVVRAFEGYQIAGARVLDWGCGLGGATMALARDLKAGDVIGIDIDAGNLEHAARNISEAGLDSRITLQLVEPGPLPFSDNSFDIIFTQAAVCHIADKASVFADYLRVLRPGGRVLCVDWMKGGASEASPAYVEWDDILRKEGLDFTFMTAAFHIEAMQSAGFEDVAVKDESEKAVKLARECNTHIETAGRRSLLEALGEEGYQRFVRRSVARAEALADGGLVFGHLSGRKPAA